MSAVVMSRACSEGTSQAGHAQRVCVHRQQILRRPPRGILWCAEACCALLIRTLQTTSSTVRRHGLALTSRGNQAASLLRTSRFPPSLEQLTAQRWTGLAAPNWPCGCYDRIGGSSPVASGAPSL